MLLFFRRVIIGFITVTVLGLLPFPAQLGADTIFTAEKVKAARDNVQKYDWAKEHLTQIRAKAATWAALSDEKLWNLPVEQSVPRSIYVHPTMGCPIHGKELIDKHGVYGWRVDPVNRPWKVQCPIGGETWPTNDFERYYRSGKDANWKFRSDLADRSLLYSTDKTRSYGVDSGTGYVDGKGNRYDFIAYYAHWAVWQNLGRSWNQALENLGEAYALTGEPRYAHKAAVLLSRIADLLPTMDTATWYNKGYPQGDGKSGRGMVLGSIWDARLASAVARAYDAILPALENDAELYRFLQNKASSHGLTRVDTPARLRSHIENGALVPLLQAIRDRRIRANEGIHQKAFAEAALALDDPLATPRWLDWLNQEGDKHGGGGHLPSIFVDLVNRDGTPDEGSAGYNFIWLGALEPLANLLESGGYSEFKLSHYPNFRQFLSFPYKIQLTKRYYPHIGDENKTGNPGMAPGNDPNRYAAAFQRYGYPELAQIAYDLNGRSAKGLHGDVFDPGADATAEAIARVVDEYGALETDSVFMPAYGLTALRSASGEDAVWMYGGTMQKHAHSDRLNLGLIANGLNYLPDLGYPDFPTVDSPLFWGWQSNTIAHNTVVVDAQRQQPTPVATTTVFSADNPLKVMASSGNGVYPQTDRYERTVVRVPTEQGFYVVDVFRVRGGSDHVYSFHAGAGGVLEQNGLEMAPQSSGTYAGPDIPYGKFYDGQCCAVYRGSGFQFLDEVKNDVTPPAAYQVEWQIADHWNEFAEDPDTRLKVWAAGDKATTVSFASGYPPSNKPGNPKSLRYLLERRTGTAPLESTFVHILDPFAGAAQIASVERLANPVTDGADPSRVSLLIKHADGAVDTLHIGLNPGAAEDANVQADGRIVYWRTRDAALEAAYMLEGSSFMFDGEAVLAQPASWRGEIESLDETDVSDIKLKLSPAPSRDRLRGRYLRVLSPAGHNPIYRIQRVERVNDGAWVHLGPINRVRGHIDHASYGAGYRYDFQLGDKFEVLYDAYYPRPLPDGFVQEGDPDAETPKQTSFWGSCASAGSGNALFTLLLFSAAMLRRRMKRR